jgi:hypothetical protein
MAFDGIRRELRLVRETAPGMRFVAAHERHRIRNHAVRVTLISFGFLLAIGGAATFWLPGPQFVIVVAGLALIAGQWRYVAERLDRLEVHVRRMHDERWEPMARWRKRAVLTLVWTCFATVVLAVASVAWRLELLPVGLLRIG